MSRSAALVGWVSSPWGASPTLQDRRTPSVHHRHVPGISPMPTVLRIDGYRFFFYSNENNEPRYIHVQRERILAKFWLHPVALASSTGFPASELN